MGAIMKHRLVLNFDKEKTSTLKIRFNTYEQAYIFGYYLQKCSTLSYISVSREVLTNDGWSVVDVHEYTHDAQYITNRAERSPFKLHVRVLANELHDTFCFDFYAFEGIDLDHINMLLDRGVAKNEISITGYRRDRETGEWVSHAFCKFAPAPLADLYYNLSVVDRADAIEYMQKLNSVR